MEAVSLRNNIVALILLGLSTITLGQETKITPIKDPLVNSPKEELRRKLFKKPDQPSCLSIKTKPKGGLEIDAELNSFVNLILEAVSKNDPSKIQPLFHKRMNVAFEQVNTSFQRLNSVYRVPYDVSVYSLWALNTVDGTPNGLKCDDNRLTVYPLYGYPLQFGLWLQIMGQLELGRIYVSLVPANGRWNIGSFHSQQWTHDSRDFATWAEEGQKNARMGYPMAAFVKYDIASKLLHGGGFIDVAMQDEVNAVRDSIMNREQWEASVKETLKDWNVPYASTMLVTGGGGILVRLRIEKELSLEDMKKDCAAVTSKFIQLPYHNYLQGVRCSYVLPREDAKKEGILGGMFLSFAELKPKEEG